MKNQKKLKKVLVLILAGGLWFGSFLSKVQAAPATSAEKTAPAAAPATEAPASGGKSSKVLRFDSLTITGEAAKPQVFYLLNRKKILIRHEPEKRDLLDNLEKSVEGRPF